MRHDSQDDDRRGHEVREHVRDSVDGTFPSTPADEHGPEGQGKDGGGDSEDQHLVRILLPETELLLSVIQLQLSINM
jgi:hypothetical protein